MGPTPRNHPRRGQRGNDFADAAPLPTCYPAPTGAVLRERESHDETKTTRSEERLTEEEVIIGK